METQAVGRYIIKRRLGQGGMATVFLAHDPQFNREVAIKTLSKKFAYDPEFLTRFRREAQTVAQLEHNAIVPVYDFGEQDGQPYLVMRYMRGGSLEDRIQQGPIDQKSAIRIVEQLAGGLTLAHQRGIVHRDIKPANILFDRQGNPYLSDFGIVKLTRDNTMTSLTVEGIIGTPAYISPEQIEAAGDIDHRVDLYALTIILYEMLTGQQPYRAKTMGGVLSAHLARPIPNILDDNPGLPEHMNEVIQIGMAKMPEDRFQTAESMSNALHKLANGQRGVHKNGLTTPENGTPQIKPARAQFGKTEVITEADQEQVKELARNESRPIIEKRPAFSRSWVWAGISLLLIAFAALGIVQSGIFAQEESEPAIAAVASTTTPTAEPTDGPEPDGPADGALAGSLPTQTKIPTLTPTATETAVPTSTSTSTQTATPTATQTAVPTATATDKPTLTPEPTQTQAPTETPETEFNEATAEPESQPAGESTESESNGDETRLNVRVTQPDTTLYAGPATFNPSRGILPFGTNYEVLSTICGNSWYKIIGLESDGWVNAANVEFVEEADPLSIPIDAQYDGGGCTAQSRITTLRATPKILNDGSVIPATGCLLEVRIDVTRLDGMGITWDGVPDETDALQLDIVSTNPDFAEREPLMPLTEFSPSDPDLQAAGLTMDYDRFVEVDYRIGNEFILTLSAEIPNNETPCEVTQLFVWEGPPTE